MNAIVSAHSVPDTAIAHRLRKLIPMLLLVAAVAPNGAHAILVTGLTTKSNSGQVTMAERESSLETGDTLENLAAQVWPGGSSIGDQVMIDTTVPIAVGAIGAIFAPDDSQVETRPLYAPWESVGRGPRQGPLRLIAQPVVVGTGHQNLVLANLGGFFAELPNLDYAIGGVVDNADGGALSLFYGRPQREVGFNIIGLEPNQPAARFIIADFYALDGSVVDSLTITIPFFTAPSDPRVGSAIVSFESLVPFWGLTLTTNDPFGFGVGDFRYSTSAPASSLLMFAPLCLLLRAARHAPRADQGRALPRSASIIRPAKHMKN